MSSGAEGQWRTALAEGRLLIQRPADGGVAVFPPRALAPGTGGCLEWFETSGRGTVYSVTIVHPRAPDPPYNVVLVELDDGARMMSRVVGCDIHLVSIGMRVQARIAEEEGQHVVLFEAGAD